MFYNLVNKEKINLNYYINEKHVAYYTETTESLFKQITNIEMEIL